MQIDYCYYFKRIIKKSFYSKYVFNPYLYEYNKYNKSYMQVLINVQNLMKFEKNYLLCNLQTNKDNSVHNIAIMLHNLSNIQKIVL